LSGNAIFIGAIIFGFGVAYFWPKMLGFVSENIPKSGALGINLLGEAGNLLCPSTCFSWGDIMIILSQRPCQPAHIDTYRSAVPGTSEATTYSTAQLAAGPQVIMATNIIPFLLIFAFLFLFIYMRLKKKRRIKASLSEVAAI
jgi:hypothetical protein